MAARNALTRRQLLTLLISMGAMTFATNPVFAKDGSGGGGSNSGKGGGDGTGSNSGKDGDSDSGDADGDSDSDDDDGDGGSNNSGKGNGRIDPEKIRDAIVSGKAISLSKAISILREENDDRVIDVRLISNGLNFDYRFKVISDRGKVKTIKMDAKTGRIRRFLGM